MKIFYAFLLAFAFVFSYELYAQHPAADTNDSLVLVTLYNATNGPEWNDHTDWLTDSVYKWHGITLDDDGKVVKIILEGNNLNGSIPPEIGNLDKLMYLYLNANQLSGSIPPEIGNLTNINTIYLNNNQLSDSIPPEIGSLQNLYELGLYYNQLSGSLPKEMGNLTSLAYLLLSDNQLTGAIPPEFGNLTNLLRLNLMDNQLSGHIPPELGNLTKLWELNLMQNNLTGNIPPELGNMTNLQGLMLMNNQLTGDIPPELGKLENLTTIYFQMNQLTGTIPPELGDLQNLLNLELYSNKMSGTIPPEIGKLKNLTDLILSHNHFSGELPKEIGDLTKLEKFRIENNELEGTLPAEIVNLTSLSYFVIAENYFDSIPDLSGMSNLQYFNAYGNRLTFEEIEPNIGIPQFIYSQQAKIGSIQHILPGEGEEVTLTCTTGGTANTYQWYKDDSPISGATDSIYTIASYHASDDAGTYHCEVKNTIATELTLYTQNYYVGVDIATFNISVSVSPADGGTITGGGIYQDGDTVTLKAIASAGYKFESWNEFGTPFFNDTTYSFVVTEDRTLVAVFTPFTAISPHSVNTDITIFPNPSDGHFTIRSERNIEKIIIYNLMGKMVYEQNYQEHLSIYWLANGIYFARFLDKNDNTLKISRLIIHH